MGRWDQARAGLLAVRASFQSDSYEFIAVTSARYTRGGYFLPGAYWAAALPVSDPPVRLTSWPIAAPPPESLAASGFIANAEDTWNGPRWYGPDPAFLLSAGFFGRYCFRAVGAEVTPAPARRDPSVPEGAVGLEFRPDDSSPRNMVRGVLWLDPASASLTAIEWTYVRLPSWARARPEFKSEGGGWVELAHLDGASVFPRRWSMQVPFPRKEPGRYTSRIERYWVGAGHVILVRGESGEIVARYPD